MSVPQAALQISKFEPISNYLLESSDGPGSRELLADYWRALTHIRRDAEQFQLSLDSGRRAIEICESLDSSASRQLARRTLDTMASAASKAKIPDLPDSYLALAQDLTITGEQAARVSLSTASVRAAGGEHTEAVRLISDEDVSLIGHSHSISLAAAALIRRAASEALSNAPSIRLAERDLGRAEEMINSATDEGPRLLQRIQLLEGKITLLSVHPNTIACLLAERALRDMTALATIHGSSTSRVAKMKLVVDGMND